MPKATKSLLIFLLCFIITFIAIKKVIYYRNIQHIEKEILLENKKLSSTIKEFAVKYNAIDSWRLSPDSINDSYSSLTLYKNCNAGSDKNIVIIGYLDDIIVKDNEYLFKIITISEGIKYEFLLVASKNRLPPFNKDTFKNSLDNYFVLIANISSVNGSEENKIREYPYDNYYITYHLSGKLINYITIPSTFYYTDQATVP